MKIVLIVLSLCAVVALGQITWTSRARIRHHTEFFSQVMQETVYELEKRGFSSLPMLNITQTVDLRMYSFHVNGTANYTNGFLISVQKIDVTNMRQFIGIPTVDGIPTPRATVSGELNLWHAKLGYDVFFYQVNGTVHKFTGDLTHYFISWPISIQKNLLTGDIKVSMTANTSGGLIRMVFRPANSLTEVISRGFQPFLTAPGVRTWSTVIGPIILDVIKNKIPFPDVCYSHC